MKKFISLALSALTAASLLASCAPAKDQLDPAITLASSDAEEYAAWLDENMDEIPDKVVIGLGSNEKYGIDMTNFEDDGYICRAEGDSFLIFGKSVDALDRAVREYRKAAATNSTAELNTVYHEGYRVEKMTIDGKDISEYTIVYNSSEKMLPFGGNGKTNGNAQYAAEELQRLILKATGVELKTSGTDVKTPMIKIDYLTDNSHGENGFEYYMENGNLYINGAPDANGCANGVYHFLQYQCGWWALMYGDSDLAESDHVDVSADTKVSVDPLFDYFSFYCMFMHDYTNERDPMSQGYEGIIDVACHGMQVHEWSGLNNWNVFNHQICHTDENLYANTFDKVMTYVKNEVASGKRIGEELTTIDISQGDNFNYCKCSNCIKIFREEGNVHSGAVLRFANRLAEDMENENLFGLAYQIFAYHGSNVPPAKTYARDDVYVTFCTDGACINHLLDGSECTGTSHDMAGSMPPNDFNNSDYAEWIAGWGEKCKNVYVWHYGITNNYGSYTYYDFLYEDFHYMSDAGIRGIFLNFDYNGTGFGRIRFEIINALIWNPDLTEEEFNATLLPQILEHEYGDGYHLIEEYIEMIDRVQYEGHCYNTWGYGNMFNAQNYDIEVFMSIAENAFDVLEQAIALTNHEFQEVLIKTLSTEVLYRQCAIGYFTAYEKDDQETIDYLAERYQLCLEYGNEAFEFAPLWPLEFSGATFTPALTLEEMAWTQWLGYREDLIPWVEYDEDWNLLTELREMPQKWQEWYETSVAETSTAAE